MKTILIISPPFYSHFNPLLTLARALRQSARVRVVIATAAAFQSQVKSAGLYFGRLETARNANTGVAEKTRQDEKEIQRLNEFFQATYQGAIPTLMVQTKHRRLDMLPDPLPIYAQLQEIQQLWQPDIFMVDQLNFAVTLALYAQNFPFVTFCPGHPTYIPQDNQIFGVPYAFPSCIQPTQEEIETLSSKALAVEEEFTTAFNRFLEHYAPEREPVKNAFRLTSPQAILFNYPPFGHLHTSSNGPAKWFGGHCFPANPPLDPEWQEFIHSHKNRHPKILISFGTFLSARSDVIQKILQGLLCIFPDGLFVAAVGNRTNEYSSFSNPHIILREFIPQTALLPYMDLVIHHGGNNSLTETLYYGKPMLIFPFSSDQFSIGHDAEQFGIGKVLNPNGFQQEDLAGKINSLLAGEFTSTLQKWSQLSRERGATFLAESMLHLL
jgi:UDP:flavonoid glycosyltransferase YjiC (YdhE family)